ncbi:LOW QUALITY PROTEIN: hypothetical protein PanWU01x14_365550 [Parasponia andersonii]|uniref:Uncharacterized protein n=1 Tax=Parasponia andersonii TaxID=3476 RepID=A0A2P5A5Y8_PARAD|nr:LOW QUALITY PROTEIN: hypothetical protein PanWU01x14_365550 [Parasponia andersonii]
MRQRVLSDQVTFSSVSHGVLGDSRLVSRFSRNSTWKIVLSKLLAEPDRLVEELDWMEGTTPETESGANSGLARSWTSVVQRKIGS